MSGASTNDVAISLRRRHLRMGWWGLAVFLAFGIALEGFHGFKLHTYLDPAWSARRLVWTLAHAHGTLLSLVNIAFAVCMPWFEPSRARSTSLASACLLVGTLVLPLGFFLSGLSVSGGDPGASVVVVPLGALFLLVGVLLAARALPRK
jgi:hypothetical protein